VMKAWHWLLVTMAVGTTSIIAQTPVLSNIETPHANLQTTVQIAGVIGGPGTVAYGPVGTPLMITGSDLGGGGTVQFTPYKNKTVDKNASIAYATVTLWTDSLLILTVPAGALTGQVQVITTEGKMSNSLPFMVTPGTYAGYCPAWPSNSQLQITTASLSDGQVRQSYSASLTSSGGTGNITWSVASGTLPAGLQLNQPGGTTPATITGTPTAAAGPVDVTFEVADSSNPQQTDQAVLSITIEPQTLNAANVYSYTANSYDGVGNLTGYTDTVMGTWVLNYDSLNRLSLGTQTPATSGPNTNPQSFCWTYDAYGNRTTQMVAESTSAGQLFTNAPGAASCQLGSGTLISNDWANYTANNQITSADARGDAATPVYDAAGHMTFDGEEYYFYDGEGRVCAVQNNAIGGAPGAWGYLYDADGDRVAKGTVTPSPNPATQPISCDPTVNGFQFTENYVLGPSGEELTMIDGSGDWQRTNVYAAGKLLATYDMVNSQPALHFHLTDPLGTRRMQLSGMLTNLGQPETDIQSLPFGDQLASYPDQDAATNADDSTPLYFTGKERDSESGNDYFGARYYASSMGRFLTPDWSAKVEPVPYAKLDNPQSLNLYAYVGNNPLTAVDPDGHMSNLQFSQLFMEALGAENEAFQQEQADEAAEAQVQQAIANGSYFLVTQSVPGAQQQNDNSSSSDQSHFVSISNYPKGAGGFAHTGIAVDSDDTRGFSTADPHTPWWKRMFGAPAARMEDDLEMHTKNGEVATHHYIHIPISAEQAQKIQAAIDARAANPGHYNLFFNNCAQEVGSALHAGGVGGVPHGEVFIPAIFDAAVWYTNTWR
jgi:RHS repeat-associated protein